MQCVVFLTVAAYASLLTAHIIAADTRAVEDEPTKLKRQYADVLALQGTAKGEILAIAKILRANPKLAIDQTAASGEYCFNSGLGTMVHFATQLERTAEDVVYLRFDRFGPGSHSLATAAGKRSNDAGCVVFPSKRTTRSASRSRDVCTHDSNCNQRQVNRRPGRNRRMLLSGPRGGSSSSSATPASARPSSRVPDPCG